MNRRTYLSTITASTVAFTGCNALAKSDGAASDESNPQYVGRENVEIDSDTLPIQVQQESIRLGDQVRFRISNAGDETVHRGCHLPWALQRRSDGDWAHVAWTAERYFDACATELKPGDAHEVTVTVSESAFEQRLDDVRTPLRPGQYRFLLVGASPYYGTEFSVQPDE